MYVASDRFFAVGLVGISALVIDNTYGMLFMGLGLPPAFTANLNLNYRYAVH
jgi:hypothetical protein